MNSPKPRRIYRQLDDGTAEVNTSGPFEPRPVEGRLGRLIVRVMSGYAGWRGRRMTPEQLERGRREQEIAARQLGGIEFPDG